MNKYDNWPHGLCECRETCACAENPGPAVFLIEREGKQLRVCTRCKLSGDDLIKTLLENVDNVIPLLEYDDFGMTLIAMGNEDEPEA